ncbi:MAG: chemotaxis protein CheD [bacterium]|nr:chemotaxis protein CheD [bacterium]
MINKDVGIAKHYLYPSNLFVSKEPHLVTTVLGSCISVCLYDTEKKIGGINHFMLPFWNGEGLASAKYGNIAMEKLVKEMELIGARKHSMIAKIFGGANQANFTMKIGERNIEIAKKYLDQYGISIVAQSVDGTLGRKILFDTGTGVVKMKLIKPTQLNHKLR